MSLFNGGGNKAKTRLPFSGGRPARLFDLPATFADDCDCPFTWTPDDRGVAFVDRRGRAANIWLQPIAGGPETQLTHFTTDDIAWFAWSRDGKQIAIARGTATQDAVLIRNFR